LNELERKILGTLRLARQVELDESELRHLTLLTIQFVRDIVIPHYCKKRPHAIADEALAEYQGKE